MTRLALITTAVLALAAGCGGGPSAAEKEAAAFWGVPVGNVECRDDSTFGAAGQGGGYNSVTCRDAKDGEGFAGFYQDPDTGRWVPI
jgi:hypothetical protein